MSRLVRIGCLVVCAAGCTNDFDPSLLDGAGTAGAAAAAPCRDAAAGDTCAGGICRAAEGLAAPLQCCDGCWDGQSCRAGDSAEACGEAGALCSACDGQSAVCGAGACLAERAVISVAASAVHTCAADRLRRLWCWGDNASGATGGANTDEPFIAAPQVFATGEWLEVAAGGQALTHNCAVHFGGSLWCWGDNSLGQLGLGPNSIAVARAPAEVDRRPWLTLAAGEGVSCGIRSDSTLWCWGSSDLGRNALPANANVPTLIGGAAGYSKVSLRAAHGCAVRDGDLFCWGSDADGQLGLEPRPRAGFQTSPALVAVGTAWETVAVGTRHTCAVRRDGKVWCWGYGDDGQVGPGGSSALPTELESPIQVEVLVAGAAHTCAIDQQAALYCWGSNESGQLGVLDLMRSEVPVAVAPERRFRSLAAGYRHTCAVEQTGVLYCWGAAESRQLGLGGTASVFKPTAVALQ